MTHLSYDACDSSHRLGIPDIGFREIKSAILNAGEEIQRQHTDDHYDLDVEKKVVDEERYDPGNA